MAFFAVAAGDTLADAKEYVGETRMAMPAFADALSLMEARYGQQISLSNIHQTRVIDPTGKIVAYRFEEAEHREGPARTRSGSSRTRPTTRSWPPRRSSWSGGATPRGSSS